MEKALPVRLAGFFILDTSGLTGHLWVLFLTFGAGKASLRFTRRTRTDRIVSQSHLQGRRLMELKKLLFILKEMIFRTAAVCSVLWLLYWLSTTSYIKGFPWKNFIITGISPLVVFWGIWWILVARKSN